MVWTRRAYREKMEISRWLPNEVLVQIIQHSLKADQATLSRVSKLFRDLCLSVLYRDVEIKHSIYAPSFCLAIIENPSRADHIRSLVLNIRPYYRRTKIRRDLILASLKLMSKLDHLSVSGFVLDNCFGDRCALLEECSFPRLIDCDISVPRRGIWGSPPQNDPADLVAAFLARHPTLKRIRIQVDSLSSLDLGFRMVTSSPVRVSLPNLEYYEGEAAFIPAINANGLQQIRLIWRSKDENVDKIIARMSPMTNPDEPFVSSHVYLADTSPYQIVTSVSTHMPYTRTLRLRRYETSPFFSFPLDMISHITKCLQKFTDLVYLAIHQGEASYTSFRGNKDEDRNAIEGWGEICPTLEACFLNYYAWRKVDGRWEEYPIAEFWALAGLPDLATRY